MKRLWLITVGNHHMPGIIPLLFFQAPEPSDRAIKKRIVGDGIPARDVDIDGIYDLTHACAADPANLKAIEAFDNANTRAMMKDPTLRALARTKQELEHLVYGVKES